MSSKMLWSGAPARAAGALLFALVGMSTGCGGSFSASSPAVAPDAGVFFPAQDAPIVTDRAQHTASRLDDQTILVIGGVKGGPVAQAERFDPGPQTFSAAGTLNTPRHRHTATPLFDDTVLVAGGEGAGGILASLELWDPNTERFVPLGQSLTAARRNHSASIMPDGTVLLIGGDAAGAGPAIGTKERFMPGSGVQTVAPLLQARTRHMTVKLGNGDLILLGGFTDAGQTTPTTSVEIVDAHTYVSRSPAIGGLNQPRAGAAIAILPDGRILVAGGVGVGGQALQSAEIYDPVRERSMGIPQMTRPRGTAPKAATLPDGRVLVVGADNTAELFNPQNGTFVLAASTLAAARAAGHSVTSLGVRGALVLGGIPLASTAPAEVFDPN